MNILICPKCLKEYSDDFSYCPKCGSKLEKKVENKHQKEFDNYISLFEELKSKYQKVLINNPDDEDADQSIDDLDRYIDRCNRDFKNMPSRDEEYKYFFDSMKYQYERRIKEFNNRYNYVLKYSKNEYQNEIKVITKVVEGYKQDLTKQLSVVKKHKYIYEALINEIDDFIKIMKSKYDLDNIRYDTYINDFQGMSNRLKKKIELLKKDQFISY